MARQGKRKRRTNASLVRCGSLVDRVRVVDVIEPPVLPDADLANIERAIEAVQRTSLEGAIDAAIRAFLNKS